MTPRLSPASGSKSLKGQKGNAAINSWRLSFYVRILFLLYNVCILKTRSEIIADKYIWKKYSIKTSKNGGAVFQITKKMVKKLKIGKKYPFYIEFDENIAKGNLIIKK